MKKIVNIHLISAFIFSLIAGNCSYAQLTTISSITDTALVNSLGWKGITISNISYTGSPIAKGAFDGVNSNIGLKGGVILSTGKVSNATGPNDDPIGGGCTSGGIKGVWFGTIGDADLENIEGCNGCTMDAAILEFDFIPPYTPFAFFYVFASEEYPCFVCSQFNDIFAFLITGPNPAGGQYNKRNIALIPGTNIPVSINSVNSGTTGHSFPAFNCISLNYSKYYVKNGDGGTPDSNKTVQYNGFTVPLPAIVDVVPFQTYHLKIAIVDVGDGLYDSAVLIAGTDTVPNDTVSCYVNIKADKSLLECGDSAQINCTTFYSGHGQLNYNWSPSAGLSSSNIPNPFAKPNVTTTYKVTVTTDYGCYATDSIKITQYQLSPFASNTTCKTCTDGYAWVNIIGGTPPYYYTWYTSPIQTTNTAIGLPQGTYKVCVTDGKGCTICDSVIVKTNCSAKFDLYTTSTQHLYDAVNMASGIPPLKYLWSWGDSTFDTIPYPIHKYDEKGFYKICLTITDSADCTDTYCNSFYLFKSNNPIIEVDVIPPSINIGINELGIRNEELGIKVYPNPATDNITIEYKDKVLKSYVASIKNMQGQEVLKVNPDKSGQKSKIKIINVTGLSNGVYILTLQNDKEYYVKRIVVSR